MADKQRPNRVDETAIAERRRKVAGLYLRRQTQAEIARALQVTQGTVSTDLKALRREWRAEALADLESAILREAAELDVIEGDAARQFAETHEVEWLSLRLKCKERRARLLGLDSPVRSDVTSAGLPVKAYVNFPVEDV